MAFYEKSTLKSGLRVITESIPHVRSVSIGVWVGAGGCWERPEHMGISHLIEHMLFKGTKRRTARQIAQAIDGRGGTLNAFTAKEYTCYYARVLDEHLPVAVDVLSDMVLHAAIDPEQLAKEKGVIAEEIKMYEDAPDDVVHDLFASALWEGHSLGRPIIGTRETLRSFDREHILAFMADHYTAENMVIAAAGNLRHEELVTLVEQAFAELRAGTGARTHWPAPPAAQSASRAMVRTKEHEQVHVVLGTQGLYQDHEDLYALHLVNTVLGGGSSSRLFQEIREERALAYSVFSYQSSYRTAGSFGVYAAVSPQNVPEVLAAVDREWQEVGRHGLTEAELAAAKEQLKGEIMLGLESTSGRMTRLGRGELSRGRVLSPDEITAKIERVDVAQVRRLSERLFLAQPRILTAVGPVTDLGGIDAYGFQEVEHG